MVEAATFARWIDALWRDAKRWRHLPLGPVNLTFKLTRRDRPRAAPTPANPIACNDPLSDQAAGGTQNLECHRATGAAVIVGVGPGFGEAAAALYAASGFPVAVVSRSAGALHIFAEHLERQGARVRPYACDVTDERAVVALMRHISAELGVPELVIYAVQNSTPGTLLTSEAAAFEECWRANCFGAFLVAREAARAMIAEGRGTILFAGSTSGTIGRPGYVNFAPGKFGLRALSQVIARELWPHRIHVAHIVIDGDIAEDVGEEGGVQIQPHELAGLFLSLHRQPRSCWTSEIDARPAEERFWEHC